MTLDLDEETRAGLRADGDAPPASLRQFEWRLRSDERLNPVGRLLWLMSVSSRGFFMSIGRTAELLGTSDVTVRRGLKLAVELGLFACERRSGPHRPNKYLRAKPPDGVKFARWVRMQRRLDLKVRAAWLLTDLCAGARDGVAVISMAEIAEQLHVHENNARAAVRQLLALRGLFERIPGERYGVDRNGYRPEGVVITAAEVEVITPKQGRLYDLATRGDMDQFYEELSK